MRKFFRYLINIFCDAKKLCEALNCVATSAELDEYIMRGKNGEIEKD